MDSITGHELLYYRLGHILIFIYYLLIILSTSTLYSYTHIYCTHFVFDNLKHVVFSLTYLTKVYAKLLTLVMAANFFKPRSSQEKKKVVQTDENERKQLYDKNARVRTAQPKWLKEFTWLRYEELGKLYNNSVEVLKNLNTIRNERSKEGTAKVPINEIMICEYCREKYYTTMKVTKDYVPSIQDLKKKPFVFGSVSYRIESLRFHCKPSNDDHQLAVSRHLNLSKEKDKQLSEAQRVKTALNELQRTHLKSLFINIFGILKHGKSFSDYEYLIDLDKAKGLDIGNTYHTRMAGLEFARAIDRVFMDEFKCEFNKANFFCIILDESTDVYRLEQCVLYLRYSIKGNISTRFVAIDNVTRPNAVQLTELIFKMLTNYLSWSPPDVVLGSETNEEEIPLEQSFEDVSTDVVMDDEECILNDNESTTDNSDDEEIDMDAIDFGLEYPEVDTEIVSTGEKSEIKVPLMVGVTTDGASVLMGSKTGVQRRLKDACNKYMIGTHCLSHRLQLAMKDCWDENNKQLTKLSGFCEQLFVFHKTSSVISAVFRNALDVLGIKGLMFVNLFYLDFTSHVC